jgi:hypothetical protein
MVIPKPITPKIAHIDVMARNNVKITGADIFFPDFFCPQYIFFFPTSVACSLIVYVIDISILKSKNPIAL